MEEQEIIKTGLKNNTKKDIICYVGMALLFLAMFIPLGFKVVFRDVQTEKPKKEVVYLTLDCTKTVYREGNKLETVVNNLYKDSIIQSSTMTFTYDFTGEAVEIPEVNELKKITADGITFKEEEGRYVFTFDYAKHNLSEIEGLSNYNMLASAQMNYFKTELNYGCELKSETVEEEEE